MANRLQGLTAFERHKRLLREAEALYGGKLPTEQPLTVKTDQDTLRETYRWASLHICLPVGFLRDMSRQGQVTS